LLLPKQRYAVGKTIECGFEEFRAICHQEPSPSYIGNPPINFNRQAVQIKR
jgi:hypothetical protein